MKHSFGYLFILIILGISTGCGGGGDGSDTPERTTNTTSGTGENSAGSSDSISSTTTNASAPCLFDNTVPPAAASGATPNTLLNLDHWSLGLPVNKAGMLEGTAESIETQALLAGYHSDWFYASEGNGVTFVAPLKGALTPNAKYTRSELRELLNTADTSENWLVSSTAQLTARVAINHVPAVSNKVAIGKIVAFNGGGQDPVDISYLLHLIFEFHPEHCGASLYAVLQDTPYASSAAATKIKVADGLALNQAFDYSIRVENNILTLSAAGQPAQQSAINANWSSSEVYFKAGAGLTATGDSQADVAGVTFYSLNVTHE